MGFFQTLFGTKKKENQTVPESMRPRDIGTFQNYKSARDLLGTYGTPEDYVNKYYEQLYQPTAASTRANWNTYVEPQISEQASARGLGRSNTAADLIRQSIQERELGLGQYGGELKARGYETGLGERGKQLAGYQQLLPYEIGQADKSQAFDVNNIDRQIAEKQARELANTQAYQNMFKTAGNIGSSIFSGGGIWGNQASGGEGGNALAELIKKFKGKGYPGGDISSMDWSSLPYARSAFMVA